MKKILFTAVLCVSSLITYAQSKEAYKEIRKYYTEKQIKYIKQSINDFLTSEGACLDVAPFDVDRYMLLSNGLNFDDKKKELAFINYFLEPYEQKYTITADRKMFGYMIMSFENPQNID
ncbi:hypothetical protein ACQ1QI_11390 [Ornithobacterium rhinotracheale]